MNIYFCIDIPDRPEINIIAENGFDEQKLSAIKAKIDNCKNVITPICQFVGDSGKTIKIKFELHNFLNGRRFGHSGIIEELEEEILKKCVNLTKIKKPAVSGKERPA